MVQEQRCHEILPNQELPHGALRCSILFRNKSSADEFCSNALGEIVCGDRAELCQHSFHQQIDPTGVTVDAHVYQLLEQILQKPEEAELQINSVTAVQ